MYTQLMDMNQHALLWEGLTAFHARHTAGAEDVTIATHKTLGLAIVSHRGWGELVCWITHVPIPDEMTDYPPCEVMPPEPAVTREDRLIDLIGQALARTW